MDIGSIVYNRCPHGPLDDNAEHGWLASGSVQHKALLDIVCNKTFLADMGHRTEFCHTGSLENFHSEMLKWCPKRSHFFYDAMRVHRACLLVPQ